MSVSSYSGEMVFFILPSVRGPSFSTSSLKTSGRYLTLGKGDRLRPASEVEVWNWDRCWWWWWWWLDAAREAEQLAMAACEELLAGAAASDLQSKRLAAEFVTLMAAGLKGSVLIANGPYSLPAKILVVND